MTGSSDRRDLDTDEMTAPEPQRSKVKEFSEAEELQGSLAHSESLDKLMRSVLENDRELIDDGKVLSEGINHGLQSFTPDLLFEQLTTNYKQAEKLYGERFIRELSGYDPSYVERNVRIPEFKRELKERLQRSVKSLQDEGLLDEQGLMTDEGLLVACIAMTAEELERMNRKGVLGERTNKANALEGERSDYDNYHSHHRYRDVALKASIKRTLRRGAAELRKEDLVVHKKESKERATIIYAIDASGSMKGEKLAAAKRAGIALAYKATSKNDAVGCVIFGKEVVKSLPPTKAFLPLVKMMTSARAARETDIAATIGQATTLFGRSNGVRHLVILTDGLQTVGKDPVAHVLEAASKAAGERITISVVGLGLDEEGESLSKKIVDIGKGSLYLVRDYEDIDLLLIEDYYRSTQRQR